MGWKKISGDASSMAKSLVLMDAPVSMAEKAIKKAKKSSIAKIAGLRKLSSVKDIDAKVDESFKHLTKICSTLNTSFLKVAAEVQDDETVDALLSLNFLNNDNLGKFVSFRPVFEKVADYLAQVTLASRLGLHDIDEAASTSAMQKIMDVSEGLRRVETSMGVQSSNQQPLQTQEQR